MACFSPIPAFKLEGWQFYKSPLLFKRPDAPHRALSIPCGQCIGCRLERSREWAVRCMHEASLYADNCFITLTYDNQYLPDGNSLKYRDFQLFMKRFRVRVGVRPRFYMCGEYGDKFGRPHFHAAIFNYDFPDKVLAKRNRNGDNLYSSDLLDSLWRFGITRVGRLTFQSAAYIARYVTKKMTSPVGVHEKYVDFDADGNVRLKRPEFTKMSLKPGIGAPWLDKYMTDVYPSDFMIVNGRKVSPPRFYDGKFEILYPSELAAIKDRRKANAKQFASDNTPDRLRVREKVQAEQMSRLKRSLDHDP